MNKCKTLITSILLVAFATAVPLVSWSMGGGDLSAFAREPARLLLVFVNAPFFFAAPLAARRIGNVASKGDRQEHMRRQDWMVPLSTALSLALAVLSPWSDAAGVWTLPGGAALRWIGLGIYTIGGVLMVWAPLHLGALFSIRVTIQESHHLVTDGPYTLLRHPRYAGCVYWGLALPLVFLSLPGLIAALLYSLTFVWRIRDEELLLAEHFGDAWRSYARRTKRLIPYVL
ncbi:isoprenylcysteine carboxylmethyltransferase family protein [Desulfovibrio aminophilus]|nr:isoprenylcysteine carboxylmethyltransferase family protein [Desulfovibrio aminophilus]MCM0756507.1 isoprenylcysteine carboxylmethyltransferase family protein [Desulfovibrio aminophilus]